MLVVVYVYTLLLKFMSRINIVYLVNIEFPLLLSTSWLVVVSVLYQNLKPLIINVMDSCGKRAIPKLKTQNEWKWKYSFLSFAGRSMKCLLCSKYKDNITSSKNFNASFIDGSNNYRLSTVSAHHASDMHRKPDEL